MKEERKRNQRPFGFSLIELMIVVTVMAVLAAVAMPIYGKYVKKTRTSEAICNLGTIAMFEETYFSEGDTYVTTAPNPDNVPDAGDGGGRRSFSSGCVGCEGWQALGRVIPHGTPLYFQYTARAGRFNSAGTGSDTGTYLVSATDIQTVGTADKACISTPATLTAGDVGITAAASYNWYYITAVGDQKRSANDKCSVFIKVIDRPDISISNEID